MIEKRAPWLLEGREEIRAFLNDASDYKLKKWISEGMPVRIEGNSWTAHTKNIEEWFYREYTRQRSLIDFEKDQK